MSHVHEILNIQTDLATGIPGPAGDYARSKVAAVAKYAPANIPFANVRLSMDGPRRVVAHASLDVNGTPVNAEAGAPTYREAVDQLQERLRHQLTSLGR
jgi:ribosome-associated translation inhibitor RaiA